MALTQLLNLKTPNPAHPVRGPLRLWLLGGVLALLASTGSVAQEAARQTEPSAELKQLRQALNAASGSTAKSQAICNELLDKAAQTLEKDNYWRLAAQAQCLRVEHRAGNSKAAVDGLERLLADLSDPRRDARAATVATLARFFLVGIQKDIGRPDLALQQANAVLAALQGPNGRQSPLYPAILLELCSLNSVLKKVDAATEQCQLVVELRKQAPAGDTARIQAKLALLALALESKTGDGAERVETARQLVADIEASPRKDMDLLITSRSLLSRALAADKDPTQAEAVLKDTLQELEAAPAATPQHRETVNRELIKFYLKAGRLAEANRIEAALAAAPGADTERPGQLFDRANTAISHYLQHNFPEAIRQLEAILPVLEARRAAVNLSPEIKARYFASYRQLTNTLAMAYAKSGDAQAAFLTLEEAKARSSTEQMLAAQQLRGLSGEQRERADGLRQRLADAANALSLAPPLSPAAIAAEKQRFEAQRDLEALLGAAPGAADAVPDRQAIRESIRKAQQRFRKGHVYVTWMYGDSEELMPLVVRDGQVHAIGRQVVANFRGLSHMIDAFRQVQARGAPGLAAAGQKLYLMDDKSIHLAPSPPPGFKREVSVNDIEWVLSESLLGWVSEHLQGADRVTFSPDGPLWLLPFDALKLGASHLIASSVVTYIPSLSWALAQEQRLQDRARPADAQELLAVGAPEFKREGDAATARLGMFELAMLREARLRNDGSFLATLASLSRTLPDLPGSRLEVLNIAGAFPAERAQVLTGPEASERRLSDMNTRGELGHFKYLHFATHGVASTVNPMLSALMLARGSVRTDEDGYLTAQEIASWNINADLVVLSACDTAGGKVLGGDGVLGLPYAFAIAGAKRTMQTLWAIPDQWTAQFMGSFYKKLSRGDSPQVALAAAKREALQLQSRRTLKETPQPWAAFVLYGL